MTPRSTAREDLLAVLDPLGFNAGRIDLPSIWPAISAWMRRPAVDVEPEDEERTFYLSRVPRNATPTQNVFAGSAPQPIAGHDLVCLELGRGSAGVILWYADGEPWAALSRTPDWIDQGPSTPHIDAFARSDDDAGRLTDWIETSPAFAVASRQPALAAEIADRNHAENLLVLATATTLPERPEAP